MRTERPLDPNEEPVQAKTTRALVVAVLVLTLTGCALVADDASASTVRHRFAQSAQKAAACFAHNAQEHSSALVSEVRPLDAKGRVEVIVRVKNGVTYATAEVRPAGQRAEGTIELMVISSRGRRELVRSLTEGC